MSRLLPFILLILVVVGLLIGVPFLLQSDAHRIQLADYLSQRLNHKVLIGKLGIGLVPPTLRLNDVSVLQAGQDASILQVERVDAALDWPSLLHANIVPGAIIFNHGVLTVHRRPNGNWDWNEWFSSVSQMSKGAQWPIHTVTWHQGECHWVDPFAPAPQELALQSVEGELNRDGAQAQFSGTLSGLAVPVTLTFEGKGQFVSSPQWSGDFRLADEGRQCVIHADEKGEQLDAKGEAPSWRWDIVLGLAKFYSRWGASATNASASALLQNWKTHVTSQPNHVTFYHAAGFGGGATEIKGDLTQRPGDVSAHVKAAIQGISMESLGNTAPEFASWTGTLTSIAEFDTVISSQPGSVITGQGYAEIKNGRYLFPAISVKSLAKAHTMAYIKKKYPDFADKGIPFAKLSAHWQAANGFITVDDGLLNAGDVRAAIAGKLEPGKRGADLYARLQIHETSHALMKEIPGRYLFGPPGHEQIQPIYGHLQGTWDAWLLRAATASKIPSALQSKLRQALKQK